MTTTDTLDTPTVTAPTPAPSHDNARGFGIASLVLGAASLVAGWTFIAPIVGLVLGIMSRKRETDATGLATAGILLNLVALVGWALAALGIAAVGALALGERMLGGYWF